MDWLVDFSGFLMIAIGAMLGLKARKRKFDRTNQFGIERFPTYTAKLSSKSKDYAINGIAILSLAIGTTIVAYNHFETWGWVVFAPFALVGIFLMLGT